MRLTRRALNDNEQRQRRSQSEQDGSEIGSVELERLTAAGLSLIERRSMYETMRDRAAHAYERATGARGGRAGSTVNHRALTVALIDSPRLSFSVA